MKKKVTLDPPSSPSLWPARKITPASEAQTIVASIPGYIERAREALGCIESRCAHAVEKGAPTKLATIGMQIRAQLPMLEMWRKEVDAIIAQKPDSGLF